MTQQDKLTKFAFMSHCMDFRIYSFDINAGKSCWIGMTESLLGLDSNFLKEFWYDLNRKINPRSTDCKADALTTTPLR